MRHRARELGDVRRCGGGVGVNGESWNAWHQQANGPTPEWVVNVIGDARVELAYFGHDGWWQRQLWTLIPSP